MADFTIFIGSRNYSSCSLRPWLTLRHTGAAFEEAMIAGAAGAKAEPRVIGYNVNAGAA